MELLFLLAPLFLTTPSPAAPGGPRYQCVAENQYRQRFEGRAERLKDAEDQALELCRHLSFRACRIVSCGRAP